MRINFWLKHFPHSLHLYCLAPVWILLCWLRAELSLKDFPHSPYTWSLSPVWALWWATNEDLYLNVFPHSWHTIHCLPAWIFWSSTRVSLGLKVFLHSQVWWFLMLWRVLPHSEILFGFSLVWTAFGWRFSVVVSKSFSISPQLRGFPDTWKLQLFANEALSTLLIRVFSPTCCFWCCWRFSQK